MSYGSYQTASGDVRADANLEDFSSKASPVRENKIIYIIALSLAVACLICLIPSISARSPSNAITGNELEAGVSPAAAAATAGKGVPNWQTYVPAEGGDAKKTSKSSSAASETSADYAKEFGGDAANWEKYTKEGAEATATQSKNSRAQKKSGAGASAAAASGTDYAKQYGGGAADWSKYNAGNAMGPDAAKDFMSKHASGFPSSGPEAGTDYTKKFAAPLHAEAVDPVAKQYEKDYASAAAASGKTLSKKFGAAAGKNVAKQYTPAAAAKSIDYANDPVTKYANEYMGKFVNYLQGAADTSPADMYKSAGQYMQSAAGAFAGYVGAPASQQAVDPVAAASSSSSSASWRASRWLV